MAVTGSFDECYKMNLLVGGGSLKEKAAVTEDKAACWRIVNQEIEWQCAGLRFVWAMRCQEWLVSHDKLEAHKGRDMAASGAG